MKLFSRIFAVVLATACAFDLPASAQTNWTSIFSNAANAKTKAFPRRASIIFIQVDGLGYGDLSCYGQTKLQTPNIDRLAASGIRFTNYQVASSSVESHASLINGKRATSQKTPLAEDGPSIAKILQSTGYRTGLIGDWDLGDENSSSAPWKEGFDEFLGYLNANDAQNFYADYVFRCAPQMRNFIGREMRYENLDGKKGEYIPDLLSKAANNFVKNNVPDSFNHHRPFFLLLNFTIPSEKIVVPSDAPYSDESWPQPAKNRAALISRLDNYVGDLQGQLQKIGMTNNVVIFFAGATQPKKTGDFDPKFFQSNLSPKDLHEPLIVNWPGKIPQGSTSGRACSPEDFLPTAAQIAMLDTPTNINGQSFLRDLIGKKSPAP